MLPQKQRFAVLLISVALLFGLSRLAVGTWLPPFSSRGLWFYSGAIAFLISALLDAPTHVTPKQVLGFSVVALIAVLSATFGSSSPVTSATQTAFAVAVSAFAVALLSASAAIWWKDAQGAFERRIARTGLYISQLVGTPGAIWTLLFLFLVAAFHLSALREALVLVVGWIVIVLGRPVEHAAHALSRLRLVWGTPPSAAYLGDIVGHNVPGVVTLRHSGAARIAPGTPLIVRGDDGLPNVALSLSYIGYADGPWLRALQLEVPTSQRKSLDVSALPDGACAVLANQPLLQDLEQEPTGAMSRRAQLIGLVASGTDRSTLRFEVLRFDSDLREGQLVNVRIGTREVLYQILNGITHDEIIQQKNSRGLVVATARKVGGWSATDDRFEHIPWVPSPNTPVFLEKEISASEVRGVGVFPGTDFHVSLTASALVTHNTAVLGILGVGKTFVALELVERILIEGARAICLDLTNQYSAELAPHYDSDWHAEIHARLTAIGAAGRKNASKNVEEGGSINSFSDAVREVVEQFLAPDGKHSLLVLNPNSFEVWRQDSKPYNNEASMASLSAAEITRIFSEAALSACQKLGMTDTARCCLVYEEAHSLVPEFSAVAADGDKSASNGSARAILQGRKFGLGCIVVTQRTASITKTILNQCNTIIALRTFDATGMDFLANYIGKDYAGVLSALPDRHGVVFGKASSCSDPVIVRFNDRAAFLASRRS